MVAQCALEPIDVYAFDLWIQGYPGETNPGIELIKQPLKNLRFAGRTNFLSAKTKQTVRAFFPQTGHPLEGI